MKTIRKYILSTIIVSIGLLGCSDDPIITTTLESMENIKAQYNLPSLSVAIGSGDKVIFAEAIGFSDVESQKDANERTQYSVGSLAKPMTGIALAKLADAEKIHLDSLVSQYVRNLNYTSSFTVKELASHIAGVPHDTPERDHAEFVDPEDHESPFEAFPVFSSHPLLFEPGTDFKYSSNGYILLSAVIESAAQINYVDFLRNTLWTTFQIENTELDVSTAGKPNEATYYTSLEENGEFVPSITKRDRSFLFGGGGFISTPSDLVKMSQATFSNNFLSEKMKIALRTPIKLNNGEINPEKYSLGWRVGEIRLSEGDEQTWTALHHGGVTDDASTAYLLVIPDCKASIAFATNYIPNEFWKIRGEMATILINSIDATQCSETYN